MPPSKPQTTQTRRKASPVTVGQLPVVSCAQCGDTMAHRPGPGQAAAVLTEHYQQAGHAPQSG